MSVKDSLDRFEDIHTRLQDSIAREVSRLYTSTNSVEIAYSILEASAVGDSIKIGEGVQAVKVKQDMHHCTFRVSFEYMSEIAKHSHDCLEAIFLISGFLKDMVNDQTITKQNPSYMIYEGQQHHIVSPQCKSLADVIFRKPMP